MTDDERCGRIVRIKLRNFLTYDNCEFFPENLNVILGPNGTGKSSVVCAICLGLGGQPSLLGRAKETGDYVKHQKKEGEIEIELYQGRSSNVVIRRKLFREKNRSQWFVNGKQSTKEAVQEMTTKLNVQMNNLCQFLPQDRVVEFAKMNHMELLKATEKAVGPVGMYDDHMKLIELRQGYKELEVRAQDNRIRYNRRNSAMLWLKGTLNGIMRGRSTWR